MSKKVVTLGEIMLRLSTPDFKRFVQADTFDITYGGGEANVAAALCNYGLNGTFVTKVPNNPIVQSAINHLRRYGVDTQFIARVANASAFIFWKPGHPCEPPRLCMTGPMRPLRMWMPANLILIKYWMEPVGFIQPVLRLH